jgi:hypothetical protein
MPSSDGRLSDTQGILNVTIPLPAQTAAMNRSAANDPDSTSPNAQKAVSNAKCAKDDRPAAEAMQAEQSQQNLGNLSSFVYFRARSLTQLPALPNAAETRSDGDKGDDDMAVDTSTNTTLPSDAGPSRENLGKSFIFLSRPIF